MILKLCNKCMPSFIDTTLLSINYVISSSQNLSHVSVFRVTHMSMWPGVYLDHYCFVLLFKHVTQVTLPYCIDNTYKIYYTHMCSEDVSRYMCNKSSLQCYYNYDSVLSTIAQFFRKNEFENFSILIFNASFITDL